MKKAVLFTLAIMVLMAPAVFAEDPIYPFNVKLNGETAVKKGSNDIFAVFSSAKPSNAEIEVAAEGQVIVNVFASDKNGQPIAGQTPAILMFQAPKSTLAQTMNGKKLASGTYVANVVAGGRTSRILFDIQ